jgi:hypothetical protein
MAKTKAAETPLMYELEKESEHWVNEACAIAFRQLGLNYKDTEIRYHVGKIGKAPFTEYKDPNVRPTPNDGYKPFRVDVVKLADGDLIGMVTVDHHINKGLDALAWAVCGTVVAHFINDKGDGFDKAKARETLSGLGYIYPEKLTGSPMPGSVTPELAQRFREMLDTIRPYPMEDAAVVQRKMNVSSHTRGRQFRIVFDKDGKIKLNGGANQVNAVAELIRNLTPTRLKELKADLRVEEVGVTPKPEAPEAESGEVARTQVA